MSMSAAPSPPVVSVIVPTFRRPQYLPEALGSVFAQTYPHYEVIVSDNGALAETAELVRSMSDPRLRYRHNGRDIGPTQNAIAASRCARGTLVAMLHDDDVWEPRFLERLVRPLLEDESLVLAFADHWVMDVQGVVNPAETTENSRRWNRTGLREGVYRPFADLALVHRATPITAASVFRKAAVDWDEFPPEVETVYDLWLAYLLARTGAGAYYCAERLSRYRVHAHSLSGTLRYDRPVVFCYDRFIADSRLQRLRGPLERVSARYRVGHAMTLFGSGRRWEAIRSLGDAVRRRPSWRALGAFGLCLLPLPGKMLVGLGRQIAGWRRSDGVHAAPRGTHPQPTASP
jgi:glycosyltransferase involved in cell wall biosynthesis